MKFIRKFSATVIPFLVAFILVTSVLATAGNTTMISLHTNGTQGNSNSVLPAISLDGRYVTFYSYAWNLISNDQNLASDVFVHDRATGNTTLVSVSSSGVQGNGNSLYPSISIDGRYIAFQSDASNLVVGDTNNRSDIFVHDLVAKTTVRVSVNSKGEQTLIAGSYSPWISANGRYVTFKSIADNLVDGDTKGWNDIFVRDLQTGSTTRVSVSSSGVEGNSDSSIPSISSDGRYVAFLSNANNLVIGDTNLADDIFVYDNFNRNNVSSFSQFKWNTR